ALEHARIYTRLKGEDHFVELRKHMGWYLGHFPGAKYVRNALVRVNSLAEVEAIIMEALENPRAFSGYGSEEETSAEPVPALDLSCAC
ncbi:MAG: hypothetical protein IRZ24_19485, partial [Thermogemmatispora sp.]